MGNKEVIIQDSYISSWINGLFLGMLVGAALVILLTPRSGEENRALIGQKSTVFRDRASGIMTDTRQRASEVVGRARGMISGQRTNHVEEKLVLETETREI